MSRSSNKSGIIKRACAQGMKSLPNCLRAACVALVITSPGAYAYNATSAGVYYSNDSGSGSVSGTVSAQYNYPYTSGPNSGYADLTGTNPSGVPLIASGGYAKSNDGGWVNTDAYFQTSMLVGPGSSGLANGTPVTIQLGLQLDGLTSVAVGNDAAYTQMSYLYRIFAPDRAVFYPGPEGGWVVPQIASFSANVNHSVDNFYSCYYPCGNYQDRSYSSRWDWSNNQGGSGTGGVVNDYVLVSGNPAYSNSRTFDTGLLLIDFDTFVGDTLDIDSYLDVWGDTYGAGSQGISDFLHTLRTTIASPYVAGLELIPGTSGTVVPLPAGVWLLGSGLLGLIGIGRRRA